MSSPPQPIARIPSSNAPRSDLQSGSKERTPGNDLTPGSTKQLSLPIPDDFDYGEVIGEGSYSMVFSALHKKSSKKYAIKALSKAHIVRYKKAKYVNIEKNAFMILNRPPVHPGVLALYATFQNDENLFFVLELAPNGDLTTYLSKLGSFSLPCARYYAAQIVDTIALMHERGVIHRDLKPDNVLLDENRRIKITDFGTVRIVLDGKDENAGSFVGSAEYSAPEMLTESITSRSSDLWALGCIIFLFLAGRTPFKAATEYLVMKKIKDHSYEFPEDIEHAAKDLIQKLLVVDPYQRLSAKEIKLNSIREHPFFESINWETLWTITPPAMEAGAVTVSKEKMPLSDDAFRFDELSSALDDVEKKSSS